MIRLCLLCVWGAGVASAQPVDFGPLGVVRVFATPQMGAEVDESFARFSDGASANRYFGAFFYNETAEQSYFYRGVGSVEVALKMAKIGCDHLTRKEGGECRLVSLIVPEGFPANVFGDDVYGREALGHDASDGLRTYREKAQGSKGHAFFVANALGNNGYSWGFETREEAEETAAIECVAALAQEMAEMHPPQRAYVRASGIDQCLTVESVLTE